MLVCVVCLVYYGYLLIWLVFVGGFVFVSFAGC